MSVARISSYGIRALTGLSNGFVKKKFANLTPSGLCKVARAMAKVEQNPCAEAIVEGWFKNGKVYKKFIEGMRKWSAKSGKELGISVPQTGKFICKRGFTRFGKQQALMNVLKECGLPKDATVLDVLNSRTGYFISALA